MIKRGALNTSIPLHEFHRGIAVPQMLGDLESDLPFETEYASEDAAWERRDSLVIRLNNMVVVFTSKRDLLFCHHDLHVDERRFII